MRSTSAARALRDTARLARTVREPLRFSVRQARRRQDLAAYRLRGTEMTIYLRHNTPDLNTLDEIFLQGHYAPPVPVQAALAAMDETAGVLDLGANIGLFAADVFRFRPGARVVSFEPDPENAALIRRSIAANPGLPWELVEACAATSDGTVDFKGGLFTQSRMEADAGSKPVPAVDIFPFAAEAAFLKVDIEGSEWEILEDPRFLDVPARIVALEYHPHLCPSPDPAGAAARALGRAGFEVVSGEFALPSGHGMLWGWKPE